MPPQLELRDIVKRFGRVLANDRISLAVEQGEIRALVGENGAGKTTLMSILYGELQPDSGEIKIRGERKTFRSPMDAIRAGLGMVHQSFMLFPSLRVVENVVYGAEPTRHTLVDWRLARQQVQAVVDRYGLRVDPMARVANLPVGVRQRVEILKALYRGAEILILDEPTSVLTPHEVTALFETLRTLRAQGKTIIFITHKLHEVIQLCDNATVLRDGRLVATLPVGHARKSDTTSPDAPAVGAAELSRAMIGRDVLLRTTRPPHQAGEKVLQVEHLSVLDEARRPLVSDVSFEVRAGEIVGIAGVAGNGQTELIGALAGLLPIDTGRVTLRGPQWVPEPGPRPTVDVTSASVAERRRAGLAYVPEDRSRVGAALGASVSENLAMGRHTYPPISRRGLLSFTGMRQYAERLIGRFAIKVSGPGAPAASLSGGNLQKITLARELTQRAQCLIVEQPTRGLDIGATEFVHQQLLDYRGKGHAILLVSAELSEILTLSDLILVMLEGRIVGVVPGVPSDRASDYEATEAQVGMLMTGAHETVIARAIGTSA